jgi:dimethylpropiothetin dethiomethylase
MEDTSPADAGSEPAQTTQDRPDFAYWLQDVLALYRTGSAGGSPPIRRHMKAVSASLGAALKGALPLALREPEARPVCVHLERAVDNGVLGPLSGTVRLFQRIAPLLRWGWGYERMPRRLESSYAYAEVLGPHGPALCSDIVVGVVLLAPKTHYPAHSHQGITESYVCLSGALSQNDAGVYVPGSMIFNPPEHRHRITTGDREPCLLAYAWSGEPHDLAGQKMSFSRGKGR